MTSGQPRRRFQVFISSTFEDLSDIREQIIQQLLKIDCIPVGMEMFPATNATPWDLITKMIDDSDYVVLIAAQRYGSTGSNDRSGISYTQKEFEYADNTKKQILIFRQTLSRDEEAALDERMKLFRERIATQRNMRAWRTTSELPAFIAADITIEMHSANRPEGWVRGGYAMPEHIEVLRGVVTALTTNLESRSNDIRQVSELCVTMSGSIGTILSLAALEKRGTRAMGEYMRIQQMKLDLAERNPMFAPVADGLMEDPFNTLTNLAKGHASVPEYQIGQANKLLIDAIMSRFDAVSLDDLKFWLSKDNTEKSYRNAIYEATQRPGNAIIATRIFVFPQALIEERQDDIAKVLEEQMTKGVEWAIAVSEDAKEHRETGAALDFALFDRDRAISYFRYQRRFDVTFNTNGRAHNGEENEIRLHLRTYHMLLTHCWLATSGFAERHLAKGDEASLLPRVASRTKALKDLKFANPERLFPLIVVSDSDIRRGLEELLEIRSRTAAKM